MGPAARVVCGLASALRIFRAPHLRMRLLLSTFVSPLLVALLVLTTPLGTGDRLHQVDLLHPLLPHVHLINGKVVTHQGGAQNGDTTAAPTAGPAIGGGAGSDAASTGLGLSPTVPALAEAVLVPEPIKRIVLELSMPAGREEAPPDPPPTSIA
jgi:hypothetical protein